MTNVTLPRGDITALPLAPLNPLPRRQQLDALRRFHDGSEELRDAGGAVTRLKLAPQWLMPDVVMATSPQGAHDILCAASSATDRAPNHREVQQLFGESLFTLNNTTWRPRRRILQPVFTKKSVSAFGGHMAQAAAAVADDWADGEVVDLDSAGRWVTLRALGRSVLGIDLDGRTDLISEPMRVALSYVRARGSSPIKAPHWLPTPARHRARAAAGQLRGLAAEILRSCRDDPDHDAPLVQLMMEATDSETGRSLTDDEICNELMVFMMAGHDTTATTLTYALWALGRHPEMQDIVRAEVQALGERELTPADLPALTYTVQVLHEALRLCPPGPINPRSVVADIEVDGYRVRAGSICMVGVYAMHRDPGLWDRPTQFDPERFSPERSAGRDRWQFIPFSAGARTCIGDHFAMLEATLALATMVRHNEFCSLGNEFPVALPFTMVADGPIPARVRSV